MMALYLTFFVVGVLVGLLVRSTADFLDRIFFGRDE